MLEVASDKDRFPGVVAAPEIVDVSTTNYQTIDGLQNQIAKLLVKPDGSKLFDENRDNSVTAQEFRDQLKILCEHNAVVLAIDTFETIQLDVAGRWVLSASIKTIISCGPVSWTADKRPVCRVLESP